MPRWMITSIVAVVALVLLISAWKAYGPRHDSPAVKEAAHAVAVAKSHELAALAQVGEADRDIERAHRMVVHDTVRVRIARTGYDFGKAHLDTTSLDSVKTQLHRADSLVVAQYSLIRSQAAELKGWVTYRVKRDSLDAAKDEKYAALERLNAGIRAEIPSRLQQIKHDAKVAGLTAGVIGVSKLILGATGQ